VIPEGEHVLDSRVEVEAPGGRAVSAEVGATTRKRRGVEYPEDDR